MSKVFAIPVAAAALIVAVGAAQNPGAVTINVRNAPANDGHRMYASYCAPCHGLDGRGNGPVAASLRQPPSDLTVLTKNNNGKFPALRVASAMRFGAGAPAAHGSPEMPVWGPVFVQMNHGVLSPREEEDMRVANLTRYLEAIQAR